MKELSVFIDESGDFGEAKNNSSYYLVTFVFHDQSIPIIEQVSKLETSIKNSGFGIEYIHTGPLIRREDVFESYTIDERRKLIFKMLNFMNSCPIKHFTVCVNRKEASNRVELSGKLAIAIKSAISSHQNFFDGFEHIIVYYDNGQAELSSLLNAVLSICFSSVEFRKAEQQRYRFLQVADFICSMELIRIKEEEKRLSKSEAHFFYKPQELKKTFFKSIDKKKLQ